MVAACIRARRFAARWCRTVRRGSRRAV